MKLKQLVEGPRYQSHDWRGELSFKSQLSIVGNFLRVNPNSTVANIYKQGANEGQFHPEDLKTLRELMAKFGYNQRAIDALG